MTDVLGVDIGASGIKGAPVDVASGRLVAQRYRIPTPDPATPDAVMEVVAQIASHFDWNGPVGCGLPAVVQSGVARTAANIDASWIGADARQLLEAATGSPVWVLNDADAAGLAEVRFGAARGNGGVVLILTFGTGIGSALFNKRKLVPNTELGQLEFHGMLAEHYAAGRLVEHDGMSLQQWVARVSEYLAHVVDLFSPSLIVFGGGISKRFEEFGSSIDVGVPVVPAELRNDAGIVGAALATEERDE